MKGSGVYVALGVAALAVVGASLVWKKDAETGRAAPLRMAKSSQAVSARYTPGVESEDGHAPAGAQEGAPLSAEGIAEIQEKITDYSTTYDPAELKNIEPFLYHKDPNVREAAIMGIVNLGDQSGADILRRAAGVTASAEEASALRKAAEFLDLPPVDVERLIKRKSVPSAAKE